MERRWELQLMLSCFYSCAVYFGTYIYRPCSIGFPQDYSAKRTTIAYPANTTFPYGICQVRVLNKHAIGLWGKCP